MRTYWALEIVRISSKQVGKKTEVQLQSEADPASPSPSKPYKFPMQPDLGREPTVYPGVHNSKSPDFLSGFLAQLAEDEQVQQ
jgi:hypothetical protein